MFPKMLLSRALLATLIMETIAAEKPAAAARESMEKANSTVIARYHGEHVIKLLNDTGRLKVGDNSFQVNFKSGSGIPIDMDEVRIDATTFKKSFSRAIARKSAPGEYSVTMNFPARGKWNISITFGQSSHVDFKVNVF